MNLPEDNIIQKMVRIFICGAHSTGKTTLAREIEEKTGFHRISEVARKVIEEKGLKREEFDPKTNPETFTELQKSILDAQTQIESRNDELGYSYICDRAIDPVVYTLVYVGKEQADELLNRETTKQNIERYRSSLVFVIKPYPECMRDDDVRLRPMMEELELFTSTMEQLLQDFKIPYTVIDALELDKRVEIVSEQLDIFTKSS